MGNNLLFDVFSSAHAVRIQPGLAICRRARRDPLDCWNSISLRGPSRKRYAKNREKSPFTRSSLGAGFQGWRVLPSGPPKSRPARRISQADANPVYFAGVDLCSAFLPLLATQDPVGAAPKFRLPTVLLEPPLSIGREQKVRVLRTSH